MGTDGTLNRGGTRRVPGPAVVTPLRLALGMVLVLPFAIAPVPASDRDLPPYMIYIDPETGKYTTRAPDEAEDGAGGRESPQPSSPDGGTTDPAAAKPGGKEDRGIRSEPVASAPVENPEAGTVPAGRDPAKPGIGSGPGLFYLAGGVIAFMLAALALRRRNRKTSADAKSPADG